MSASPLAPVLLAATLTTGLTAGFLVAFAHTVMPGLGSTGDRTFVGAFQAIDRAVENPWFGLSFVFSPLLVGAALVLAFLDSQRAVATLVAVALGLVLITVVITAAVHLPLNRELGDIALSAGPQALGEARAHFEDRWVRWNIVRAVTSVGSFAALAGALLRFR